MTKAGVAIHPDSNWQASAQALVNGLAALPSADERQDFLEIICDELGEDLYPAFLHLLFHVNESGTVEARQLVATTLVECLLSGRLPAGASGAWGATGSQSASCTAKRYLGPIEYLCAWQAQGQPSGKLTTSQFTDALGALIGLVDTHVRARELYIQKLLADSADAVSGSYSRQTRKGMSALADGWSRGQTVQQLANGYLSNVSSSQPPGEGVPSSLSLLRDSINKPT